MKWLLALALLVAAGCSQPKQAPVPPSEASAAGQPAQEEPVAPAAGAAASEPGQPASRSEEEILRDRVVKSCASVTGKIDGWMGRKFTGPVPVDLKTRDEIADFARETSKRLAPEGMVEIATELSVRLHQIPPGYDLLNQEIEMLKKSVAGLYDADADTFYVVKGVGSPGSPIFTITVAHELVHAYRDVDKDYWPRMTALVDTDVDWMQAVRFLVEGDAQFLGTVIGQAELTGLDPGKLLPTVAGSTAQRDLMLNMALADPNLADFPLILREGLVAAYIDGMVFAVRVHAAGGLAALDKAYDRPPRSTEQVLHPEKYLGDAPDEPTVFSGGDPTAALGDGWKLRLSNVMGEFDMRVHFTEILGRKEAARAAAGWDGARFWFCAKEGQPSFYGMLTTWDTEEDAREFADAWARWAAWRDAKKEREFTRDGDTAHVETKEGLVVVRRNGRDVLVADGVPEDRVDAVLAAMAGATREERRPDATPVR